MSEFEMREDVLDHGYVGLVESWGGDESIIEAARMSTGKGFLGWGPHYACRDCGCKWRNNHDGSISLFDTEQEPCATCVWVPVSNSYEFSGDEKLLAYLYRNKHSTPFEMAGLTIEVKAPIFVFRQWHRHRTQSYNEMSARYTPLPAEDYLPTVERLMENSTKNKQAGAVKGSEEMTRSRAEHYHATLRHNYMEQEEFYQDMLRDGVPKELARLILPVARYSVMRASANLRNWLAFLTLRMDPHAQYEIRVYAEAVGKMIQGRFPRTWELFEEGRP